MVAYGMRAVLAVGLITFGTACSSGTTFGANVKHVDTERALAAGKTVQSHSGLPKTGIPLNQTPTEDEISAGQAALAAFGGQSQESPQPTTTKRTVVGKVTIDEVAVPTGSPPTYRLKSQDGADLATITLASVFDKVRVEGEFPGIQRRYEVNQSKTTIEALVKSYVENGVLVDGKVQLKGLERYCKTRSIQLKDTGETTGSSQSGRYEQQSVPRPVSRLNRESGASTKRTPVSLSIRSECSHGVRVFFGDEPKSGSGRYGSISPHSVQSETLEPGRYMWIVDDRDNGMVAVEVTTSTREVRVTSDCSSLTAS